MAVIKKRKFFDVEIPSIEKTTQVMAYELEELDGKYIKYDLTRILRGKGAEFQLKIKIEKGEPTLTPVRLILMH